MDLLEYGIKNQDSNSRLRRLSAEGALGIARVHADLYERHIESKQIHVAEHEEETRAMLERIYTHIERQTGRKPNC